MDERPRSDGLAGLDPAEILFFDVELDASGGLAKIGAVLGGDGFTSCDIDVAGRHLASLVGAARFVAGHHVHAHDLPIIAKHWPDHPLLGRPAIDTLLWSPLVFPARPYHHLVKDRTLVREQGNDPRADAASSRTVLGDELAWVAERLRVGDPRLSLVRRGLVDHMGVAPWRGATEVILDAVEDLPLGDAIEHASAAWSGHVCELARNKVAHEAVKARWPSLACAYAAMWMTTAPGSVLPPWVWRSFPETGEFITFLRDRDYRRCAWCAAQHSPEAQLQRWFPKMTRFRELPAANDGTSLQRAVVAAGMRDASLFAVMPTGGGKSVAFQVPAFARFARRGVLTIVISPLQSLMKDQVDNLIRDTSTTHVAALSGALTPIERHNVLERVRSGEIGLLYVSPEQLRNPGVRKLLECRQIGAWVFDEAHCIAEWGHDFRPDFWYAPRFIRELAKKQGIAEPPPVAAFTATAQPEVTAQILERFRAELGRELTPFGGHAERPNLVYRVEGTPARARFGRALELLEALRHGSGSAVVFAPTRNECESVAAELSRQRWAAAAYHGGLDAKTRRETQERFIHGELRVIVATSAFGMGVDKPDVRLVIHLEMPSSLESYLQQAGRAGRDGQRAECVLLYDGDDLERLLAAEQRGRLRQREIQLVLAAIRTFAKRHRTEITAGELARLAGADFAEDPDAETRAVSAVAWLERAGIIRREENLARVFRGRPRIQHLDEARRRLASEELDEADIEAALGILHRLFQQRDGEGAGYSADDLAELVGLCQTIGPAGDAYEAGLRALRLLERMAALGILSAGVQISASIAAGVEKSSSLLLLHGVATLQSELLGLLRELHPDPDVESQAGSDESLVEPTCELDLVGLCRTMAERDHVDAVPEALRRLLQAITGDKGTDGRPSWAMTHAGGRRYRIRFHATWDELVARARRRIAAASVILGVLGERRRPSERGKNVVVELALSDLTDALRRDLALRLTPASALPAAERALLFLHDMRVLELRHGLAVFRTAMRIETVGGAERRRFNRDDYEPLAQHYEAKQRQIQAMNLYAATSVAVPERGLAVANDWFTLPASAFCARWIRQIPADERAKRILGPLDEDQTRVVRASPEQDLVVVAGPGSGKTTTVVHRVAWLVHEHDVRPEGMLVLCYNRPHGRGDPRASAQSARRERKRHHRAHSARLGPTAHRRRAAGGRRRIFRSGAAASHCALALAREPALSRRRRASRAPPRSMDTPLRGRIPGCERRAGRARGRPRAARAQSQGLAWARDRGGSAPTRSR